ncbi:MAG: alpha/beta hydrolase [Rhizobiales bacterium]|nr:alpha/beta hydrolase [Hyphomicrobiales bacterium]
MQLYPTPENPLPAGAVCVPVKTRDGVRLRALYAQVQENPKGTVVLIGGRGDFMERYFETMRDLMARGFAVATFDFRGQGGSQRLLPNPLRNHIKDFRDYDEDFSAVMTQVVIAQCPKPYFALAHSTGGHVLLRNLRRRNWFARAIIVAPLVGLRYGLWPLPLVRVLVFLSTSLGLGWMFLPAQKREPLGREDFPDNPLTSDRTRWERDSAVLEQAPQLGVGAPTFSWLKAARKATAALRAMRPRDRFTCPVLMVAAGLDRVVDNEATHRLAERIPGVSLIVIRESLHELLTERDEIRNQFLAVFDAFVEDSVRQAVTEPAPAKIAFG